MSSAARTLRHLRGHERRRALVQEYVQVLVVQCHGAGSLESLSVEEVPFRPLAAGQVRVAVHAAHVTDADLLLIQDKHSFKPPVPFIPGSEIAGEVSEVSPDVRTLKVGDRVMGILSLGGYAGEVVIAARACMQLPKSMDFVTAAAFMIAYGTADYALSRAALRPGQWLLVHDASSAHGAAAVDLGLALGARVIAVANDHHDKRDSLVHANASTWQAHALEHTAGAGIDVVYANTIDSTTDIAQYVHACAWNGRVLITDWPEPASENVRVCAELLTERSVALVGAYWAAWQWRERAESRRHLTRVLAAFEAGQLQPLRAHTFPLPEAKSALATIIDRHARDTRARRGPWVMTVR